MFSKNRKIMYQLVCILFIPALLMLNANARNESKASSLSIMLHAEFNPKLLPLLPTSQLVCLLFRTANDFPSKKIEGADKLVIPLTSTDPQQGVCTFQNLAPGLYAISVFLDKNKNGLLDSNFIGLPTEPYGFSNNAPNRTFGPPTFKDAVVELSDTPLHLKINLNP